jgi:glycine/D-amino acid oxidase-like deaminating enzyme
MARVDLTVRGAGVFGLASAHVAARRGARVRVIDPGGPGAGASGGLVGALAPHAPDGWTEAKALQLRALRMAGAFWAGVAADGGGDPGYAAAGRVQPLADARALAAAEARAAAAASAWGEGARWTIRPAAPGGWEGAPATGLVVHDTLSARLSPRGACAALVAAIRARGGEVAPEGPDEGAVLHATGAAGLGELSAALAHPVGRGVKGQAAALAAPALAHLPQLYVEGLHIVPHADGTVALGSTSETAWEGGDGATDAQLDTLIARVRALVPALRDAPVVARWAGVRPRAASRTLALGPWPGRPGHFVANGGFKTGFAMAPLAALLMIDLILGGQDAIPAPFRLENLLPQPGARG